MIDVVSKWIAPGLLVVLGGTVLTIPATQASILADLESRATTALHQAGHVWAGVELDMRDVALTGMATGRDQIDRAMARLASLHGVRTVTDTARLAPLAAPYPLSLRKDSAGIRIEAAIPDGTLADVLVEKSGATDSNFELMSGAPDRRQWLAAIDYALLHLSRFDEGAVSLADLEIGIEGRAASQRDFADLQVVARADLPAGATLGRVAIVPALAKPYEWSAEFDGRRVALSGFVPAQELVGDYRQTMPAGIALTAELALASGAPRGFAEVSQSLLRTLPRLDYGSATIRDGASTLTGAPPSAEVAQIVTEELQGAGSIVALEPPPVANYWLTATRTEGGPILLDGYVPDDAARERFAAVPNVDAAGLELARGAPQGFDEAVDFGLRILSGLDGGRFAIRSSVLTVSGTAGSAQDQAALLEAVVAGVPEGFVLAQSEILPPPEDTPDMDTAPVATAQVAAEPQQAEIVETEPEAVEPPEVVEPEIAASEPAPEVAAMSAEAVPVVESVAPPPPPPVADPYVWTATKTADGVVTLAGHLPAEPLRRVLMIRAGEGAADTTQFASGAPEGFIPDSLAAMDALALLSEGTVTYDGLEWSIAGTFAGDADEQALHASLAAAATPDADWSIAITPAAPPDEPPVLPVEPAEEEPAVALAAVEDAVGTQPPVAAVDACRSQLAAFSAGNAILFQSGSASIAPASREALGALAGYVAACPDVPVYVEGHTDADGTAQANLALSVARAEAVVGALIDLGIAPARLYAVGYGESAPIASNDTAQGKRLNRRIVVTLENPVQ